MSSQLSTAIMTVVTLASLVVLARTMSVATFGQYAVVVGIATTVSKIAGLNIYFHYRNRYPLLTYRSALATLRQYLPLVVALGMAGAGVVVVADLLGYDVVPIEEAVPYILFVLLAGFVVLSLEIGRFYYSIGRNQLAIWLSTSNRTVLLALLVASTIVLQGESLDLTTVLMFLCLANLGALVVQLAVDTSFAGIGFVESQPFEWRSLVTGFSAMPAALYYEALSLFDRLSVASVAGYETAGHYSLAGQGILIAYSILGGTLISLIYPTLVRQRATGDTAGFRAGVIRLLLLGTSSALVGAVAIWFLADAVTIIFGEKYAESAGFIRLMCLVPLSLFGVSSVVHLAYLHDLTTQSAVLYGGGVILTIALNYVLVRQIGVPGAIVATYASLLFQFVGHLVVLLLYGRRAVASGARS